MENMPSILTPDFGLLFWMLLSFLVVFFLLAKYGFPAIVKAVEERKNFIDESLKNAREANEKRAGIQAESETLLREARDKAQAEGRQQLEEAKKAIEAEKELALRDIRSQVADLSMQIAEKVLRNKLAGDGEQEKYIERMLDEVK